VITSSIVRRIVALNLPAEAMREVLSILAEAMEVDERRKEAHRVSQRKYQQKLTSVLISEADQNDISSSQAIETVEEFPQAPNHFPHGHTYELSTYSDSKVGTPLKKERKKEERKKEGSAEQVEGRKSVRGCRLPDDWMPSLEDQHAALRIGLTEQQIQVEADKFRDYWHAKAGARATSVKWPATWRNWCRTAKERNGHGYNGQRKGLADIALEMAAEARQRERAQGIGRPDDLFRGA